MTRASRLGGQPGPEVSWPARLLVLAFLAVIIWTLVAS